MAARRVAVVLLFWLLVLEIGLLVLNLLAGGRMMHSRLSPILCYHAELSVEASAGFVASHFHIPKLLNFLCASFSYVFERLKVCIALHLAWMVTVS
jgi:hypothetical protein